VSSATPLGVRHQVLYRMYDSARRLLYVGITTNVEDRLADHRGMKSWWADVASIELQHFTSREAVEAAELDAIRTEEPVFNVRHGTRPATTFRSPGAPAGKTMRHRNFRLADDLWADAARIAALRDERISDVMRSLVRGYVAKHRKLLDADRAASTDGR
jgi:predicted GIY-YIG superfamily endonuclease